MDDRVTPSRGIPTLAVFVWFFAGLPVGDIVRVVRTIRRATGG